MDESEVRSKPTEAYLFREDNVDRVHQGLY